MPDQGNAMDSGFYGKALVKENGRLYPGNLLKCKILNTAENKSKKPKLPGPHLGEINQH